MRYYYNTPYNLNMKIQNSNIHPLISIKEINEVNNNLNYSINNLENRLIHLKQKSKILNNALDCNAFPANYMSNSNIYSKYNFLNDSFIPSSPNLCYTYRNFSTMKKYPSQTNIIKDSCFRDNIYLSKTPSSANYYKKDIHNFNNKRRINYKFNNNYNQNKSVDYGKYLRQKRNPNAAFTENNEKYYKIKCNNLNKNIIEKDQIIDQLQDLVEDTMNELNKYKRENYKLQDKITKLKSAKSTNDINSYSPYNNNLSSTKHFLKKHLNSNRNNFVSENSYGPNEHRFPSNKEDNYKNIYVKKQRGVINRQRLKPLNNNELNFSNQRKKYYTNNNVKGFYKY